MEGIFYLVDENGKNRFVQIDLEKHGALWEDFHDLIVANLRAGEITIPYDVVKEELRKYGKI